MQFPDQRLWSLGLGVRLVYTGNRALNSTAGMVFSRGSGEGFWIPRRYGAAFSCILIATLKQYSQLWYSLVPRCGGGGGERAPGTHCLRMCFIATEFDRVHIRVRMYTGDVINSLCWCASSCAVGVLFEWVLYHAVLYLLVTGYLEIKFKMEQVASNECRLPWTHAFMRLSTNFTKSILTTAYQTFIFVPDSVKLDRACSSDVYSILRTKAGLIFMVVYAIYMNRWSSYSYTPLILPCSHCYNYVHAQTVCTRCSFSSPSSACAWEWG